MTITPANSNLKDIFDIQAVLGPPNASNRQIAARLISPTLPPHTESAQATGTGTVPGTHASGTVAIDNFNTASSLTLTAGSVFTNTYGAPIHMVLDATVTVPPAPSQTVWSQRLAPGHILEVGTIGNNEFNNNISGSISWSVFNSPPFSNGKDPVTYTAVQLSDINNAANALEQANTPNSQQVIQPLVHVNERLIGTPQCTPNVSSDHVTGDRSTSVTVTVTFTCTGEVYDYDAAMVMATNLLHTQASKQLGSGFALVGTIKTTLTNVALQDMQQKGIVLTIATEGFWVYRFNDTEKQALLKVIIGKSKQAAEDLLLKQSGVRMAQVSITSGNGNNLPIDIRQITLNIVSVPHP